MQSTFTVRNMDSTPEPPSPNMAAAAPAKRKFRLCTHCTSRIPSFALDNHTLCTKCRNQVCDSRPCSWDTSCKTYVAWWEDWLEWYHWYGQPTLWKSACWNGMAVFTNIYLNLYTVSGNFAIRRQQCLEPWYHIWLSLPSFSFFLIFYHLARVLENDISTENRQGSL